MPNRQFLSVVSDDLTSARNWYVGLFGYRVEFQSDWFVHLQDHDDTSIELGLLARTHDIVPEQVSYGVAGGLLTIVVDDVDTIHRIAQAEGFEIVQPPRDLFYGQRRMILRDPDGTLVDVSSECEPDPDWLTTLS